MKKALIPVLVLLAIGLVAGLYHLYRGARVKSAQPCWNKLVQIEGAKEQWDLETKAPPGSPVTLSNIVPYLRATPTCNVASATYIVGKIGEEPKCTVHGTVSNFKPDHY